MGVRKDLDEQRLLTMSWAGGNRVPTTFFTVLTTLCMEFQYEALQLPDQTELVSRLSGVSGEMMKIFITLSKYFLITAVSTVN